MYEYYFEGIKSDSVYAIINGNERYLVKDLLNNNPTDYVIFFSNFERAGLKFIRKEKYPKIEINVNGNLYLADTTISNKEIFEIGYGTQKQGIDDFSIEIFIIPKQSGQATLTLNFENSKNNKVEKIKNYTITINENLEVEYEEK